MQVTAESQWNILRGGSSFAFAAEQNPPTRRHPSPSHDAGSLAPCRPAFLTPGTASLSSGAHFGGRPLLLFKRTGERLALPFGPLPKCLQRLVERDQSFPPTPS